MVRVSSFPPIAASDARVLVLGTMPGVASLRAQQYYAHPRNAFWPIIARVLGFEPGAPYPDRVAHVMAARIAVWDVLESCLRPGSLDSEIDETSAVPNDFATFFASHRNIERVCFNGAKAEALFRKRVLGATTLPTDLLRLPSTSPANASVDFERKARIWHEALTQCISS
jgi:hypoxanthine-DNA glycosylase